MKGKYIEIWENLKEENKKLFLVIIALIVVIALLLMTVISLSANKRISIYIPGYPMEIKAPSKELGLWWARYYVNLLGNFTQFHVDDNYRLVMLTASPKIHEKILKEIENIKDNKISQDFLPYEGSWEFKQGGIIKVKGLIRRWIGSNLVEKGNKRMVVKLIWKNGVFMLEDWWYE